MGLGDFWENLKYYVSERENPLKDFPSLKEEFREQGVGEAFEAVLDELPGSVNRAAKNAKIEVVTNKTGHSPKVYTINGFLTEGGRCLDWEPLVEKYFPKNHWNGVLWESQRFRNIFEPGMISPFQTGIHGQLNNIWKRAVKITRKSGELLAEHIANSAEKQVVLVGHSLGGRIVYETLNAMTIAGLHKVSEAHIMGAAVTSRGSKWKNIANKMKGKIVNYYSEHDLVLKKMYHDQAFLTDVPSGLKPISGFNNLININTSEHVDGHNSYKKNVDKIFLQGQ